MRKESRHSRWPDFLLLVAVVVPYFTFLGTMPLCEPDEGRYAEIPREMIEQGDFVTPRLNYVKYFDKPVLHYWLTAAAFRILGPTEFAARLWPAIFSVLCVWGVLRLGSSLYGRRAGRAAALVLAGSPLWFVAGRINSIDPVVSSLLALCLMSFMAFERAATPGRKRWFLIAFFSLAALAVLAKGLIGGVLPAGIIACYIICTRRYRLLRTTGLWWGIPLMLAIAGPWFVVVSLRNPDYAWYFFVREHFLRFTSSVHHRTAPIYYFVPIVLGGLLPFTAYQLPAFARVSRRIWKSRFRGARAELFLVIWVVVIFTFFSLSHSKRVFYVLPLFPALALLTGRMLARVEARWAREGRMPRMHKWGLAGVGVSGLGFAVAPMLVQLFEKGKAIDLWPYALPTTAALVVTFALATRFARRRRIGLAPFLYAGIVVLALGGSLAVQDHISTRKTALQLARTIIARAEPEDRVVNFGGYLRGLSFYTHRRVVLTSNSREMRFGRKHAEDRDDWFWSLDRFLDEWHSRRRLWVVVGAKRWEKTIGRNAELAPYTQVGPRDGNYILVTNRPLCDGSPAPSGSARRSLHGTTTHDLVIGICEE